MGVSLRLALVVRQFPLSSDWFNCDACICRDWADVVTLALSAMGILLDSFTFPSSRSILLISHS